jgi:hypothetical protein
MNICLRFCHHHDQYVVELGLVCLLNVVSIKSEEDLLLQDEGLQDIEI